MRAFNFYAGPATLPLPVLEAIKEELPDWQGLGMSVLEISHRSKQYDALHQETKSLLKELYAVPDTHEVLFMGGGATLQFAAVPLNLLAGGGKAAFVLTGAWAKKAYAETTKVGKQAVVAASSEETNFDRLPRANDIQLVGDEKYVHLTSNNTIFGTQYRDFPDLPVPVVCDMSSDILSHRVDVSKFALIYAGAQKNMGPAGVTVLIGRKDTLDMAPDGVPTYLAYKTHLGKDSLYNTPPVFAIYTVNKVLGWIKSQGGLEGIERANQEKYDLLYGALEGSDGFYAPTVQRDSRSYMNVTFRLANTDLEPTLVEQATRKGFIGLKGHRSVGGIRVSMYNAMPVEGVAKLVEFLEEFKKSN